MNPLAINWVQLLHRIGDNSCELDQLERLVSLGAISFENCLAALLSNGFTIPEAQELYALLRS